MKYISIGLCLTALVGLTVCQPTKDCSKTTVTMMYPIVLEQFERLVEKTYPDIDLQIESTTTAALNGDSERRLRNGRSTDLVVTTLPTGDVKEYMMDLSAAAFSTSYQSTVMNPVMVEGKAYYLSLPGQYSGYILNTTLLARLGKPLPVSNTELLALLDAGIEQGVGIGPDGTMFGIDIISTSAIGSYLLGTYTSPYPVSAYNKCIGFHFQWKMRTARRRRIESPFELFQGNIRSQRRHTAPAWKRGWRPSARPYRVHCY